MDSNVHFGLLLGLAIVPIALAALVGEWLNEQARSKTGFRTWVRNLASWVRGIALRRRLGGERAEASWSTCARAWAEATPRRRRGVGRTDDLPPVGCVGEVLQWTSL